jgi:hypothetical protein
LVKVVPEILEKDTKIVKAIKFWYYWNKLVEDNFPVSIRYKVEDFQTEHTLRKICPLIGIKYTDTILEKIKKVSNTTHSSYKQGVKPYKKLYRWKEIHDIAPDMFDKVKGLAKEYGYGN